MLRCVWPCLFGVAGLLPAEAARAGAFNRAPGEGLAIYASGFTQFGRFVDARGRGFLQPPASKFESSVLVEYGLADWLTAMVKPGFVVQRDADRIAPAMSGGATLGLQVQAWRRDDMAVAVQASGRFARGDTGAIGTGEERAAFELRALAGRTVTIGNVRAYVEAQAAYRLRRSESDEIIFDATVIAPIAQKTDLQAQVFMRFRQPEGHSRRETAHKASIAVLRRLNHAWSFSVGLFTTLYVRQARREQGATFSLHRRF